MSGHDTSMSRSVPTLLAPKFLPPLTRATHIRRERLHSCLDRSSTTPITLVSAPAGCGKTALVASWLVDVPNDRWAWLSLDALDNDPVRLWAHLIEAVRTLADGSGDRALHELVQSGGKGPIDRWLGPLVNDLAGLDRPMSYLVVDDLHVITDADIRGGVTFLMSNLPTWLRLIIITRADPPLALPRLRAEGRLTEIRQSALRFDGEEAERLLQAEGVDDLADDQLDVLMERTEGWAAGLQLAVITLGDNASPDRLLHVAGSNMAFSDYIVSEVIDLASDEMRTFLFTTVVLDRVCPSLAEAVSGLTDAARILREAQQRGLFLVALDEHGDWFRYHHLFAEAVQAEARLRSPELVRSAHERAAVWFERGDDLVAALDHWLSAGRPDEAMRIAVTAGYRLIDTGQVTSVERIARLIPPSAVGRDADRQLDYAMLHNHVDARVSLSWVNEACQTIAVLPEADPQLVRRLHNVRAMTSVLFGHWSDAVVDANAAIALGAGPGAQDAMTERAGLNGMRAKGWLDDHAGAEASLQTYLTSPWTSAIVRDVLAPSAWALAAAVAGRVKDAERWHSAVMARSRDVVVPQASQQELIVARALIHSELGDTHAAREGLDELRAAHVGTYLSLRAMGEAQYATSLVIDDRLTEAAGVLAQVGGSDSYELLGPRIHDAIDRAWTELHLAAGDLTEARRAAERMRAGFWAHATLVKVCLAEDDWTTAAEILRPLAATSPRQHVTRLLLRAQAHDDRGYAPHSDLIEEALTVAFNEGMMQTVVNAARTHSDVLEPASAVVPEEWMNAIRQRLAKRGAGATVGRVPTMYEQPTERERIVARYLPSRLTVPEIAEAMGVTPNTLKTHLKSLYRKLDVTSRDEAVARSRQLGIIA